MFVVCLKQCIWNSGHNKSLKNAKMCGILALSDNKTMRVILWNPVYAHMPKEEFILSKVQ